MADKAASPGLISRILPFVGRTNNKGEAPKKPTPAKLGSKNSMYYCEKRKRWIDPATDDGSNDDANGPPPPPKAVARVNSPGVPQANPQDHQKAPGPVDNPPTAPAPFKPPGLVSQGSVGKRSLNQRYVNTFSSSSSTDNRNASQTSTASPAAFLPPFSNAPNSTRMFVPPANLGGGKVSTFVPSAVETDASKQDTSTSAESSTLPQSATSEEPNSGEESTTNKKDTPQSDKPDEQTSPPGVPEIPQVPLVPPRQLNRVNTFSPREEAAGASAPSNPTQGNTVFPVLMPVPSIPNSSTKQGPTPAGRPPLHPGQPTQQNSDAMNKKTEGLSLDDIMQQAAKVTPVHSANPSPMPKMPKDTQEADSIPLQNENRGLSKKSLHDAFHTAALALGVENGKTTSEDVDSDASAVTKEGNDSVNVVPPREENGGANVIVIDDSSNVGLQESGAPGDIVVDPSHKSQQQREDKIELDSAEADSAETDRRNQEVESLKETCRQLEERCNSQQSQIQSLSENAGSYQKSLEEKDAEISRMKAANVDAQAYRDTLNQLQQLENVLQQRDREEAILQSKIEQLEQALKEKEKAHEQDLLRVEATTLENAQKEADEEMSDLLVCLGQETAKVERLSAALLERGGNLDEILHGLSELDGTSQSPALYDPPVADTAHSDSPSNPTFDLASAVETQFHSQKGGVPVQDDEGLTRSLSQLFRDSSNGDLSDFEFSSSSNALEQLTEAAAMSPHPPVHQQFDQSMIPSRNPETVSTGSSPYDGT